jgi:dsDNA-specific endonuclease/ATPase MutS2
MDTKTLEKLEFNKIRNILANYAVTYIGKNISNELIPYTNKKEIR